MPFLMLEFSIGLATPRPFNSIFARVDPSRDSRLEVRVGLSRSGLWEGSLV